ncbi:entry exclusion protein TrbK [Rhizobium mesoamericanum]|uniref:entry exclusion protein TrbK n=1 Tax=Rhizobium mesoamericanum TaxID=1079800 RepID=UPI0002EE061E|nr:entry exclusion protein TrbK [Rhizobium mesoamericanum]
MVKTKIILLAIAIFLMSGSVGIWFFLPEMQAARERRESFFGSSKDYPTSGGEKMKVEW